LIVQMLASFETPENIYILTEFIPGGSLRLAMSKLRVLENGNAQFHGASIFLALEALHDRDIVFRDLKPENVMLDASGYVKLVDFGIAKHLDSSGRTFSILGTPQYMSPEIICRAGHGTESDIWSFGVLLYELLCGRWPFGNSPSLAPRDIFHEIIYKELLFPESCDRNGRDLLQGLLKKKPEFRLGCGCSDDVKGHDFFMLDNVEGSIFDQIISREAISPCLGSEVKLQMSLTDLTDAYEFSTDAEPELHTEVITTTWTRTTATTATSHCT